MPDQHDDLAKARTCLERADAWMTKLGGTDLTVEHVQAAAQLAAAYVNLGTAERWQEWRDEDVARWARQREDAAVNDAIVEEYNRLSLERERKELALVDQRADLLAGLDAATLAASGQREQRAEDEARPHDDEGPGQAIPSCEFVHDGKRCVFGAGHQAGYHHLEDGTDVDGQTGQITEGVDRG